MGKRDAVVTSGSVCDHHIVCAPVCCACCRRVIILVKAGAPVDQTIDQLCEVMEPGDIIIDGGNEW